VDDKMECSKNAAVQYNPAHNIWTVSRFEDVIQAMRDTVSFEVRLATLPSADVTTHARIRRIIARALGSEQVKGLAQLARTRARELADNIARREQCDIIEDFALPIALTVLGAMLRINTDNHAALKRWSEAFLHTENPLLPEQERDYHRAQVADCRVFMTSHIVNLAGKPRDQYVAPFLTGVEGEGGLSLSEQADVAMFFIIAASQTTSALIGNSMLVLLKHPTWQSCLRAEPGLIPPFVEEVLRWDSPVVRTRRLTTCPAEIGGTPIPQGAILDLMIASANRDPGHFEHADAFRVDRTPNDHIGLGFGRHLCLGAQLARLEVAIALEILLQQFPGGIELDPEEPIDFGSSHFVHGPVRLPVRFPPPAPETALNRVVRFTRRVFRFFHRADPSSPSSRGGRIGK